MNDTILLVVVHLESAQRPLRVQSLVVHFPSNHHHRILYPEFSYPFHSVFLLFVHFFRAYRVRLDGVFVFVYEQIQFSQDIFLSRFPLLCNDGISHGRIDVFRDLVDSRREEGERGSSIRVVIVVVASFLLLLHRRHPPRDVYSFSFQSFQF